MRYFTAIYFFLFSMSMLLLPGCVAVSPKISPLEQTAQQAIIKTAHTWHIQAKLSIKTKSDGAILNLDWQQQRNNYQLDLTGPLGQQVSTLQGNLEQPSQNQAHLEQHLNLNLPVQAAVFWIKGLSSHNDQPVFNSYGQLVSAQAAGWQLKITQYEQFGKYRLPKRLRLAHPNSQTDIKLVIKNWHIDN